MRVRVVAAGGDVHFLQQGAQQLLAVLIGGGRRVPDLAEVVAEGQDRGPLGRGEGLRPGGLAAGELGFSIGELLQGGVPFGFQAAGDQPVVRVDGPVAALGPGGVVAGLLDLTAVLVQRGVVAVLELRGGVQAGVQRGRLAGRPGTPRRRRRRWPARRRSCAGRRGRRPAQQTPGSSSSGPSWPGRGRRWPACGRRCPQVARPCSSAQPSRTAPVPGWLACGRMFEPMRAWLAR